MGFDTLSRRVDRLEAAAGRGGADHSCVRCGQAGPPMTGEAREDSLRVAERESLKTPGVESAHAVAPPCPTCGRPRVIVIECVRSLPPPA